MVMKTIHYMGAHPPSCGPKKTHPSKPKAPPSRAVLDAAALREVPWISVDGWGDWGISEPSTVRCPKLTATNKSLCMTRLFFQMLEEKL